MNFQTVTTILKERRIKMTNMERIKNMSEKELATLLVQEATRIDDDCDWDEVPFQTYDIVYELPNGDVYNDYSEAVDECVIWLQEDTKKKK